MTKMVTLRLEQHLLKRVKALADRHGVGWQTMMKILVATAMAQVEAATSVELPKGTRKRHKKVGQSGRPLLPGKDLALSQAEVDEVFEDMG